MANQNRGERLPGEVLAADDVRALLRACNKVPTGARNRALLVVLWRGGLRIAEALALRPVDLDAAAGLVRVRRGKGGRPRHVGLDPKRSLAVDAWAGRLSALGTGGRAPLFCTLRGGPLDPGYCRHVVKRLARKAGIRRRVHLHGFPSLKAGGVWYCSTACAEGRPSAAERRPVVPES